MKLLVVTPYPPTPPFAGGRRRILEQLRAFSRANEVDLACLTYSDADEVQLQQLKLPRVRIFSVRQEDGQFPQSFVRKRPYLVERFWNSRLMECIAALARGIQYDWVAAEHCYAAVYLESLAAQKMVTEHNIEYRIFEQIARHDGGV